ncbi:MAG: DNA/RNA nuclease SfsA [Armatimonadetes bacterium]|nr:DNA/RNA nuclease SfsA [Armatimonadota bacterium]
MKFESPLIPGRLVRRYKRFLADVALEDGSVIVAHCPNPGSMLGCCAPDRPVFVSRSANLARKLPYTLELIDVGGHWVGVNTMRPNAVVHEALQAGQIAELGWYTDIRREVKYGDASRVDFLLEREGARCYLEVKHVTLVHEQVAYFPDSVTTRGARHLQELRAVKRHGHRAAMLFVVNDPAATVVRPADSIDPAYGRALRQAARSGVEVLAYRCRTSPEGLFIDDPLRVDLTRTRRPWRY